MTSATAITAAAAAFLVAAATGGAAYASMYPTSQVFGEILIAPRRPGEMALTYDDGPNPAATPMLLDVLAAAGVKATFFVIGRFVREQAVLTRRIVSEGHLIGNHSMTHPNLARQSESRIREELAGCNAAIEDAFGGPVRLFRPPFGYRRPAVLRVARELGLTPVNFNVIVSDWMPTDAATVLRRMQNGIARNRQAGRAANIVLHDGSDLGSGADRLASVEATRRLLGLHAATSFVTPADWLSGRK
jgi:peptidoglycan/xylan/chitin deacetylase (PgdA/CDA1 family)